MPTLNYQRLTMVQEFSAAGTKALNPISFVYGSTGDVTTSTTISNLSPSGIASNNSQIITSDFTGNGSMDFLMYPYTKDKFFAYYDLDPGSPYMQLGYQVNTGVFKEIFSATSLSHENKILAGQGMLLVKPNNGLSYKFEMFSSGTTAAVYFQYDRQWTVPLGPGYYSECDGANHPGLPLNMDFVSGDFNGDGLTDL
ncbi:MAG: hypothetical protein EOO88_60245, partial [Pedobacter sp.]